MALYTCRFCGVAKPVEAFPKRRSSSRGGSYGRCKACHAEVNRLRYHLLSPEEKASRNSSPSVKAAKARCRSKPETRAKEREQHKLWAAANRERRNLYHRLRLHKLTRDRYFSMLDSQGGRCAACGVAFDLSATASRHTVPAIDHDHRCCPTSAKSCGQCVRGLLCGRCNAAAGLLKDSPDRAVSLARYLLVNGAVDADVRPGLLESTSAA